MENSVNPFIQTIISPDPAVRNRPFLQIAQDMSSRELLSACEGLEAFRHTADNLYTSVRACHFLYAAYRFFLMESPRITPTGTIPVEGYQDLLGRRFEQAITTFRQSLKQHGPNGALCSALAACYHHLTFQTLADQVRRSVRASAGNRWMFRVGHADDHAIHIRPELLLRGKGDFLYPVLVEETPVRLDLSHSGWSDIFFLGMDYPEGARVLNISVDLGIYGRDACVRPPIASYLRVIPEAIIRLTSVDLQTTKDIRDLRELFNFGNDYLSLLKAGVIASGLIPPSFEGIEQPLTQILSHIVGPGMGIELVTNINDIPKGSRLAVSTNLLASIISVIMRATGQVTSLIGTLTEPERRLVASRAILGEWLGGSGGGWQDSGGIWPGFKIIQGTPALAGDPEFGISAGCLLPRHHLLGEDELAPDIAERLVSSLALVHGGLAQNVGPILEMVTEKYLLRSQQEWSARQQMREIFDGILSALKAGDLHAVAGLTTENWDGPLKTIIPWVSNRFTETLIARARQRFGADYWGFLMLGGMSGGGMGLFLDPARKARCGDELLDIMQRAKSELQDALPFAMDPVIYNFGVNARGTYAHLLQRDEALMPNRYYALQVPELVRTVPDQLSYTRRAELDLFTARSADSGEAFGLLRTVISNLFRVAEPASQDERMAWDVEADGIKAGNGFDAIQHELLRADLRSGRIGLAHNRLSAETVITDVRREHVTELSTAAEHTARGAQALREGRVAVLTLAGGVGSRWTHGAGVIKALNPFLFLAGQHRSFLDIHLQKTLRTARSYGASIPQIISTSYLTHDPIAHALTAQASLDAFVPRYLSPGQSIGQRLVPMVRDLLFLWEETAQEELDEQQQKVRAATRAAWLEWARTKVEGSDYIDNVPLQRFNPPGHWYEVPNLFRNGVLARLLSEHPQVDTLMLHNVDTLGADLDPTALGCHLHTENMLTFEVVPRRFSDHGGGLARVNGRVRLLEGLSQPHDEDDLGLSYYNTLTTWINIDALLTAFGLTRADLTGPTERIAEAIRLMARRMPTYVTVKEVKRRWGHAQEDIYPVVQFEKLWGDMTALPDFPCGYLVVPRFRGQQLKDPSELDAWAQDGSREYVAALCEFEDH